MHQYVPGEKLNTNVKKKKEKNMTVSSGYCHENMANNNNQHLYNYLHINGWHCNKTMVMIKLKINKYYFIFKTNY